MRYVALLVVFAFISSFWICSTALARKENKKALGLACNDCHVKGKFKQPNLTNALYKKALEMTEKIKKGEKEYKGKCCMDCHQGKRKPETKKK